MRDSQHSGGFTIIEVMLFLAISGLMIAGVIMAISGAVNQQRYAESVNSFQDYIQSQYAIVTSVRNNRPHNYACDTGGIVEDTGGGVARGRSSCSIIGRYVRTDGPDGTRFISSPIYATVDISVDPETLFDPSKSINEQLLGLGLIQAPDAINQDNTVYTLAWQTNIYTDQANPPSSREVAMVLVRMPTSGLVQTFIRRGTPPADVDQVISGAMTTPTPLCVATGGLTNAPPNGVRIIPAATNAGSVQFIPADGECRP